MSHTRREFVLITTAAAATLMIPKHAAPSTHDSALAAENALLDGDPYTAHVDECGLGGRTWDAAHEHALRYRSTADDRDRYVLGLEI